MEAMNMVFTLIMLAFQVWLVMWCIKKVNRFKLGFSQASESKLRKNEELMEKLREEVRQELKNAKAQKP